ncbi:MAG TPA: S-layer homology domain-containing protein [Clostridia bacterium]|nr:S-layer homology domain-containing protein [Clostridia bacterium]
MGRKTAKMFRKLLAILTICTLITLMFPGLVLAEEDVPEEDPIVENGATGEEGDEPADQDEEAADDQGEEVDAPSEWAVPEIELAIENGLVTEKVLSNYQDDITREDFCELIVKLYEALSGEEAQIPEENVFTDTENPEILKANALGIVFGKTETEFFPNDNITREEIAVMFYRALKAVHPSLVAESFEVTFADMDEISDWALEAVGFMSGKGIIKGMDGNIVAPKANTLREQAIALVYRTYELFKDVEIEEPIAEEEVEAEEPVEGEAEEEPVEDGSEEGDGNDEDEPEEGEENDEEPVDEETEE